MANLIELAAQFPGTVSKLDDHTFHDGKYAVVRFPNGFGISAIPAEYGDGAELALIQFHGETLEDYRLKYSEPFYDVIIVDNSEELLHLMNTVRLFPAGRFVSEHGIID